MPSKQTWDTLDLTRKPHAIPVLPDRPGQGKRYGVIAAGAAAVVALVLLIVLATSGGGSSKHTSDTSKTSNPSTPSSSSSTPTGQTQSSCSNGSVAVSGSVSATGCPTDTLWSGAGGVLGGEFVGTMNGSRFIVQVRIPKDKYHGSGTYPVTGSGVTDTYAVFVTFATTPPTIYRGSTGTIEVNVSGGNVTAQVNFTGVSDSHSTVSVTGSGLSGPLRA